MQVLPNLNTYLQWSFNWIKGLDAGPIKHTRVEIIHTLKINHM